MRGATYEEFADMVREGWEIEFSFRGHECFYQRSGHGGVFDVYVLVDGEVVLHETGSDMGAITDRVLELRIYDGKTAKEAQDDITVTFEA